MNQAFVEYFERYQDKKERYVYVSLGRYMAIGKILLKSKITNNTCNQMEIIDIIDKFNVCEQITSCVCEKGEYVCGEITNEEKIITFCDKPEDAFWSGMQMFTTSDLKSIVWLYSRDQSKSRTKKIPDVMKKIIFPNNSILIIWPHDTLFVPKISQLPRYVEYLDLGNEFDDDITHIPESIKVLKFGKRFNQPVDNLPHNVKHIVFGERFNKDVDHLPDKLETIEFGERFGKSINYLPDNVRKITFKGRYGGIVRKWPKSLEEVCCGISNQQIIGQIPEGVIIKYLCKYR